MKKLFSTLMLVLVALTVQAQILQPVKWKIQLNDSGSAEKEIVFTATADKGWHLYDQDLPEGGPVSTSFTFETLKGAELIGKPTSSVKPTTVYDELFAMNLRWYPGTVSFTQKFKVTDPAKFKAEGEVEFMACNDETCLPPDRVSFSFDKKNIKMTAAAETVVEKPEVEQDDVTAVQPDTEKVVEEVAELKVPTPVTNKDKAENRPVRASNELTDDAALWTPVIDQLKAFGDTTVSATDTSWLFIFFAGFLGGLIALLTPCVWPMIPMTVSFFLKRTKDRKKAIRDAMTYGLSIIVIYLVMGLLITGIFGASALNDLSTNAIFNIIFFLLLVVFAISFFGAFEMVLPSSWTNKLDTKADSTTGIISIFFMSFTLVLVSFSCTGPIIGTLLVQAASMGTAVGPAIGMFGFALALSIPFSLFAIFPNMLQSMPKSGGWLNSVKVVLGFLELALALKFLSVADLAYGWRLLDREVFIVLWIVIFILLGCYLLGKIKFSHDSDLPYVSVPRLFIAIISFSFAVYMVPGLWGAPLKAISAFVPPLYTQDFNLYNSEVHAAFDDYETGTVIRSISEQTGYEFSYDETLLNKKISKVSVNLKNEHIENVLKEVFKNTGISYKIVNNRVFLKDDNSQRSVHSEPVVTALQQQKKKISGVIVDDTGLPVIGANIVLKGGAGVGTITNIDGEFTLEEIPDGATLLISYIGYLDQEILVTKDKNTYQITLHEDTQKLDEVVVVGYGVQKKVNMTGSISNVKSEELSVIPNTNLSNSLAGRAPGATITGNSGLMGASSEIRMRGGFGDPLFVIDGVIRDKEAFDNLEPYEIDQMSFLKDAASASIYGSAAGNGVVLVTTKGGVKNQKPVFNYQGSYAFSKPTQELFADRWTAIDDLDYQNAVARFQGTKEPNGEAEYAYFRDNNINYNVNDYIWQNPWNTKHSLSVTGGSEKVQYYVMGSFLAEEGS